MTVRNGTLAHCFFRGFGIGLISAALQFDLTHAALFIVGGVIIITEIRAR